MRFFTRRYGASPLHLLGHLAAFAITYYALSELLLAKYTHPINWIGWFVGGALLHDLVFLPLYAILDLLARIGLQENAMRRFPAINYVRVPVVMAATMFLVFFPLILKDGIENYRVDTGHEPPDYLGRWLLICAGLFLASAVAYVVRTQVVGRRGRAVTAD